MSTGASVAAINRSASVTIGHGLVSDSNKRGFRMGFLSYLISGLGLGSVYAIIALGYTMVYGIAKMLNFAHGDVIMIGAYVSFFALNSFGLSLPVTILLAVTVCTALGIVIEKLAYKPLRQASSLATTSHCLSPTQASRTPTRMTLLLEAPHIQCLTDGA